MDTFRVTFFGVGGSSAAGSPDRQGYGSNTVCTLVEAGEQRIILDMGSGIIHLCASLANSNNNTKNNDMHILLSHYHYDHIEGFPFLKLPYGCHAHIWAEGRGGKGPKELLYGFMRSPYFPVTPDIYNGSIEYHELESSAKFSLANVIEIETMHLNHPGMATGYKLKYAGKSIVYLLDYEHGNEHGNDCACSTKELISFCQNVDLLIYDAQFTDEEYNTGRYKGWGHSTYSQGAMLANKTGVKKLLLSHHANWRSDEELDAIGKAAAQITIAECVMAREGLVISI